MGRILYRIIDGVVLTFCLPFYLVVIPIALLYQLCKPRICKLRPGQIVRRWQRPDVLEELRVIDVSRLDQGVVGFQQRSWNVLRGESAPDFPETVEHCSLGEFWFGRFSLFGTRSETPSARA